MAVRSHPTHLPDLRSLEQLVSSWPDAVLVYDSDSQRYLVANHAAERLLGYGREEIARLSPSDLSHPDDAREIPAVVEQAERDGSVRRPWRALRKDGTVVQTEMTLTRRLIDGRLLSQGILRVVDPKPGEPAGPGVDVIADVTVDVSVEERLRILERTSLAVVMLDRGGVVTYWNAGAAEQYGLPAADAIGRQVLDLAQSAEDRAYVESLMNQHVKRDDWISRFTVHRRDQADRSYDAMVTCSAIRSNDGELSGFLFVAAPLEPSVRTASPRMRRVRVQCAACGREVAGTMRRKYCSEKCRQWAYYHRHLEAQRARSRQRHERGRGSLTEPEPVQQAPASRSLG
jgi:PAS domain S-box-containing protein